MRSFIPPCVLRSMTVAGFLAAPLASAITPVELSTRLAANENLVVIDVRPANAYAEGHIPGAINIPLTLLPYKPLPNAALIVVCGDGRGLVDDVRALSVVRAKSPLAAEALNGGYAAWLSEVRLSTSAPGVTREKMPVITYDQLLAAPKGDLVLVDLRAPVAPAGAHAISDPAAPAAAATAGVDLLDAFAQRLGVPVVAASPHPAAATRLKVVEGTKPAARAAAAAPADTLTQSGKLLVLVADSEADANDAARQLRAKGHHRFTILIGGTEAIRYEGRIGSGRMTGGVYAGQPEP